MSELWPLGSLLGAAAVAVLGWYATAWRATLWWVALGLAGFCGSLLLVDAGPVVRYQHYRSPTAWLDQPLGLGLLTFEALAVSWGLIRGRSRLRSFVPAGPRARWVAIAVGVALTSATVSANPAQYVTELVVATAIQLLHLTAAVLAALAVPPRLADRVRTGIHRLLGGPRPTAAEAAPRLDRYALILAVFSVVVPALLAVLVYERHPHVPDETAYLLHARYFATGRLWLPVPEPLQAFDLDLMFRDGARWYSPVPPGWPAMLAIGVWAGVPWLVNPLLNGAGVLLAYLLLGDLYGRRTARIGTALFALSPWNLFLAMSLLTHTFTMAAALAAALGVVRWKRRGSWSGMVIGGICIGMVSLIRPLEGLIVALLLGCWTLGSRPRLRAVIATTGLAVASMAVGAVGLAYNARMTGSPTAFPIMAYTDQTYGPGSNALGFGPERGLGWSGLDPFPGHALEDVVINANLNFTTLNVELLGWPTGAAILLLFAITAGPSLRSDRRMIAAIIGVVAVHSLYWFSGGPDFGPRYWHLIALPCVALAASGVRRLIDGPPDDRTAAGQRTVLLGALLLASLIVFIPWRATDKYFRYRGMRPDIRQLADRIGPGPALILVSGRQHPDYASAAVYNPLDLSAPEPVFAWDASPAVRRAVLARYPDRPVYLVDGPTLTGNGYSLRAGPINAGDLIEAP